MLTFVCAGCREVCQSDSSDEEALADMRKQFGEVPPAQREVLCDDCYQEFMKFMKRRIN